MAGQTDDAGDIVDDDGLARLVAVVAQAAADAEPLAGLDAPVAFGRFARFVAEVCAG